MRLIPIAFRYWHGDCSVTFVVLLADKETRWPEWTVTVLCVTPCPEDQACLAEIFSHSNWRLYQSHDCRQAMRLLNDDQLAVVICDDVLPDGNWKALARRVTAAGSSRPVLIVASKDPDVALWTDVLNLGAYDVLWKPFDQPEVIRAVSLAWLHWKSLRPRDGQTTATLRRRSSSGPPVMGSGSPV